MSEPNLPLLDILPPIARPPSPIDPTPITIKRGNIVTTFDPLSFASTDDEPPSEVIPMNGSYQMARTPSSHSRTPSLIDNQSPIKIPPLPVIPTPSRNHHSPLPSMPTPSRQTPSRNDHVIRPIPAKSHPTTPPPQTPSRNDHVLPAIPSKSHPVEAMPRITPLRINPVKIEDATPVMKIQPSNNPFVGDDEPDLIPHCELNFYDTSTPVNATRDMTPPYMYAQTVVKSPMIKVISNSPVRESIPPVASSPLLPLNKEPSPQQTGVLINKLAARQRLTPTEKQQLIDYLEGDSHEKEQEPADDSDLPYYMRIPDYGRLAIKAQMAVRDDFLRKFEQLRGPPFNFKIGEIDPNMSLEAMHISYNSFIRVFNRNYEVDQYFMGLFLAWAGMEALSSSFGFPIKGYTLFQLKRYETYRTLLNGLGETYDDNGAIVIKRGWAEDYGPLTKIIIMSLFNVIFFVIFMFVRRIQGDAQAELMIDGLATKFYGSGDIKLVEKVVNEVANGPAGTGAGDSGFNFGSIINSIAGSGALTNIGGMISNLFGGGTKQPEPHVAEVAMPDSPKPAKPKVGTYDDVVPSHMSPRGNDINLPHKGNVITPVDIGINNTYDPLPKSSSLRDRFRPRY